MSKGSLSTVNRYLFSLCLLSLSAATQADNTIFEQARSYLQAQLSASLQETDRVDIRFSPLNDHILTSSCDNAMTFHSSRDIKPGRFSLKAECHSPRNWSTRVNGSLEIFRKVLTSERALPAGSALNSNNTLLLEQSITSLRQGFYTDINEVRGYETRTPLRRHQVVSPRQLSPPVLIHKGDEVTITAGSALMAVKMTGIALQDGRKDQQISIQNKRSGKIIRAQVVQQGEVKAGH